MFSYLYWQNYSHTTQGPIYYRQTSDISRALVANTIVGHWDVIHRLSALLQLHLHHRLNTLGTRQSGRHFADDIFKYIFLNENARISLKISLKFVPKVRVNNIPALVQIMAWRRPCDKPLSEPMMVSLLTHICVTRPQWVNTWLQYIVQRQLQDETRINIWVLRFGAAWIKGLTVTAVIGLHWVELGWHCWV